MYMLRAYQSPSPIADCGPQCAHMPNFASGNQAGMVYVFSDVRVAAKGPTRIPRSLSVACWARILRIARVGIVFAISFSARRRVNLMVRALFSRASSYDDGEARERDRLQIGR